MLKVGGYKMAGDRPRENGVIVGHPYARVTPAGTVVFVVSNNRHARDVSRNIRDGDKSYRNVVKDFSQ